MSFIKRLLILIVFTVFFTHEVIAQNTQPIDYVSAASYFKDLRETFAKNQKDIIEWTSNEEREALMGIFEKEPDKFIELSKIWLDKCPVDAKVHLMRASLLSKIGKQEDSIRHRYFFYGLLASIINSGDGKTPSTAYKVISVDEEYTLLNFLGAETKKQSLIKNCDVLEVKIDGVDSTIYFDISINLEALQRTFNKK